MDRVQAQPHGFKRKAHQSVRFLERKKASLSHTAKKAKMTEMASKRNASVSRPIWMDWNMDKESVDVRPGMLPATKIVAPNSPRARANAKTMPAMIPRPAKGR